MDPITIGIIVAAIAAGSGGIAALAVDQRKKAGRGAMRTAIKTTIPCGSEPPVSLLDIFWDLGSSDFALEMMAHRELLLDDAKQLGSLVHTLPGQIEEAGSYRAFVDQLLESIQEYFREHRSAGNRRAIPALSTPAVKALPAAGESGQSRLAVAHSSTAHLDWRAWRQGEVTGQLVTEQPLGGADVDKALQAGVGSLLNSLFAGSISLEVKRWTAQREAKKLREELDRALEALHAVYASAVRPNPQSLSHLHDAGRRWTAEANRIELLANSGQFAEHSWGTCAELLLDESVTLAARLAAAAHTNVEHTLSRIDDHAARRNPAMAGYLVYVNRYALFVGRMGLCDAQVRAVEAASERLKAKLSDLERRGLA